MASTNDHLRQATADVFTDWISRGAVLFARRGLDEPTARRLTIAMIAALERAFILARALESYTRVAALELADRHIRVNCISPQTIHTGLIDNEHGRAEMRAATILQPLIHVGQPGEVAALAHFLASSDCGLITGQAIALDGGKSAGISRAVQHLVVSAASLRGPGSDGQ